MKLDDLNSNQPVRAQSAPDDKHGSRKPNFGMDLVSEYFWESFSKS